jgi:4-amino-4-deoxy-L-arabinose transferase-like glycosyltransferase
MGTAAAHEQPRGAPGWLLWLVLALAWCATMQLRPLFDPDEGRYAEIPREMLVSGDWVTPRFDGLKYFEKPPLQYWATAAVYAGFGVSEWTSRLWGCALGFACLPLVFAWVQRLYGRAAALTALCALSVSPYFAVVTHLNLLDAGFTFWLSAAVFAFTLGQAAPRGSRGERDWMLGAWALAALAVLSKGIVVAVLTGSTLVLYTLVERDASTWRRLHLLPGLALFALITAPWFVLVSRRNANFAEFFFVHEHFARFLTTVHQRVEPWWFFLPLLLVAVLPWLGSCIGAGRRAWQTPTTGFRPLRFLLIYAGVTLVFFSASGSKLAPYILPMLPVLAAVTGAASPAPQQLARRAAPVVALLALLLGGGLLIYSARVNNFLPPLALYWAVAALVAAGAGLVCGWLTRRLAAAAILPVCAGAVLTWQCLLCEYGAIPPARSARDLVAAVRPFIGARTPLYSVGQFRETISPYLGRTLQLAGYEGELQFGLREEPQLRLSTDEFASRWSAAAEGVAFFDPGVWDQWRRRGLPGRVLAADNYTVAVSRL